MAFLFNLLNSFVQARWVSHYKDFDDGWCFWVVFFCGAFVFFVGMMINVWSDKELLRLKGEGKELLRSDKELEKFGEDYPKKRKVVVPFLY
jgi:hypothetical protein